MFPESDLLPISALQHLIYCDRQCALIHIEQAWAENSLTVHGKHLHERADSGKHTTIGGVRIVRSLPLRSLRWGLIGKADVVEFRRTTGFQPVPNSAVLDDGSPQPPSPGAPGNPFPIEYKRGKPKPHDADRVQLCARRCASRKCWIAPSPPERSFTARPVGGSTCHSTRRFGSSRKTPSRVCMR